MIFCMKMKPMKIFVRLLFFFSVFLAGLSCKKEEIIFESFEPTLEVVNRSSTVRSGEDLRFIIRSNHDTYILRSWSIDSRLFSSGEEPITGKEYVSGETLVFPSVTVGATHNGIFRVVVEDPLTHFVRSMEVYYTAISVVKFGFEVLTPLIHDGDDFTVRVSSTHSSFVIKEFESPISFLDLRAGNSYSVGPMGYKDFTAKSVSVTENGTNVIRIVLHDPESSMDVMFTGSYESVKPTVISVALVDIDGYPVSTIYDGDTLFLRVYDTQSSFVVADFWCEFGNFFTVGSTYEVSSLGYCERRLQSLSVKEDHTDRIMFVLRDPVNGITQKFEIPYVAKVSREG